jgi:curved DNA-binding protein CbpA
MKHYTDLNFYELLEIPPGATRVEIQKAYEMAKKTYSEDSLISYSLPDPEFRKTILQRIEEAFRVLGDDNRRRQYDIENGFRKSSAPVPRVAVEAERAAPARPQPAKPPSGEFDLGAGSISGPRLKEVRERQGIPLQEVAQKTRINITYLQYIEAEKFSMLPAEVFLRGYLDQYARAIFLAPAKVVEGYLRLFRDWKKENTG